ncbi:MAG: peptidylprolyl isomerase [Azoarcus sp.]|nr:peptidylprolyl isomerase [Azoarcus sp.]
MNRFLTRIFVGMLAVAAVAVAVPLRPALAAEVDRIVAVVNSEAITLSQLRDGVARARINLQKQAAEPPPANILERQVLEQMIVERAQLQRAREAAIRVDEAMIDNAIGNIAANNRITVDKLRAAIEQEGISWEKYRDDLRVELTIGRLHAREVNAQINVSEAEIDNFLKNHPDVLSGTEYRVAHIVLGIPENPSEAQMEALRTRADTVLSRLRRGENFGKVATDSSDAPDNIRGGEIGWRDRERLPTFYADALAKLEPGGISPPMLTASGLHIVKLLEKRERNRTGAQSSVDQTHARHILLKTSEVFSDTDAKARLDALRERILNGTDFAELAKAHSADISAARGGDLGWVNPGTTVPEFEKAMDALLPNEVSVPVRSPHGWHIIQVLERRKHDMGEEHRRNTARMILFQRKGDEALEDWQRQLRDSAYVEYRLESEATD